LIRHTVGADYGVKVRYEDFRPGEVHRNFGRTDKARRELGYAPAADLADGLQKTWKWFAGCAG
jgi:nucleoside-diphosphate-sugar epimerase